MPNADAPHLTSAQAYQAAYRFVIQYARREPSSESLRLMVGNMSDPVSETGDPATPDDWQRCVEATLRGDAIPDLD
jgi:hypothetical protein